MILSQELTNKLLIEKPTVDAIRDAHQLLLTHGYQFIGYHGTNYESLRSIVPFGFNPLFVGRKAGTARGQGFYVAWLPHLSKDYAHNASHSEDTNLRLENEAGQPVTLRIYARNFLAMQLGIDFKWGILSRSGDPNGDLNIQCNSGQKINNITDLELIFAPHVYSNLAAIPSTPKFQLENLLNQNRLEWTSYLIDEETLKILVMDKPESWPYNLLPLPLRRESSDPYGLVSLKRSFIENVRRDVKPLLFSPSVNEWYPSVPNVLSAPIVENISIREILQF